MSTVTNPLFYETENSDKSLVGPILTDEGGELEAPILTCWADGYRCPHLGIHDHHYFYCSAQDAPNLHTEDGKCAYPWRGAGAQINSYRPNSGCPYLPKKE